MGGKQLGIEYGWTTWSTGGQVNHEAALFFCSKGDQQHAELHQKPSVLQVEEGDLSHPLSAGEATFTHLQYCIQIQDCLYKKDIDLLEQVQ